MLDILLLRKDLDTAIARLETRKKPQAFLNVEAFQALESERKTLQTRTEELQAQRNQLSKQIGMLMGKGDKEGAEAAKAQVAASKVELEQSAARLEQIQAELQAILVAVPNLPHESVPVGSDESGNVEVRRWGTPASFAFEVKDHVDVGTPLGLDFDMGVKLSGSRFTVMKGPIARLHRALAHEHTDLLGELVALGLQLLGAGLQGLALGFQGLERLDVEEGLGIFAGLQALDGGAEVFAQEKNI